MYLLVDYRESAFINKLSEYSYIENDVLKAVEINNIEISYKITSLPVGDFIIQSDLSNIDTVEMIIERKSIKDLCASITDGRFREQKRRLFDSVKDSSRITYIIEGIRKIQVLEGVEKQNILSQNIISGSILNLIYKHNYRVVQTENKLDTFNNILLLYKKFKNGDFKQDINNQTVELVTKSKKISENKLINQLCLISGVSSKTANVVINEMKFTSIQDIITSYLSKSSEKEKEEMLCNIIIDNSKKIRKVGNALSKKIYYYFCK
jgi:crossover junction endonuclease MUS81|uniref:ERCC4 domain-containing protein n=1 Tax=viral metagenome TaxID=1070528 RepID=A0A6C0ALJ7_9ZZZZ